MLTIRNLAMDRRIRQIFTATPAKPGRGLPLSLASAIVLWVWETVDIDARHYLQALPKFDFLGFSA